MTPQSLMAFVFAFAFALPASADEPQWVSFEVGGKAYFALASERDDFVQDESVGKKLRLYTGTHQPALAAQLVRGSQKSVTLLRDQKTQPANDVVSAVRNAPTNVPAPQVKRASDTPPQTVDPEVAKVLALMPSPDAPAEKILAQRLATLKASDAATFQKIVDAAADPKKKEAVIALIRAASTLTDDADWLTYIRSHAPGRLGGAGDDGTGTAGNGRLTDVATVNGDDTGAARNGALNPIMQAIVANNPPDVARKAAIDEIVKFVVDPNRHFVTDDVAKDKGQMDRFTAAVKETLTQKVGNASTAQDIGFIYSVLIAGPQAQAPDWITKPDSRQSIVDYLHAVARARDVFIGKLTEWTKAGPHQTGDRKMGPWAGGSAGLGETSGQSTTVDAWSIAFVTDAGKQAADSLKSDAVDKETVGRVTKALEKGWADPISGIPTTGDGGDRGGIALNFTAASFTTQEIYRNGAIIYKTNLQLPGQDAAVPVEIALKLKYRQQNGVMVPMLDIVDVSHDADGGNGRPAHVYGQAFDLQAISQTPGDLRLQNDSSSYYDKDKYAVKYQLSRGADGTIHFGIGEQMLDIKQDKLYSEYTDAVMHNAHTVVVNGHQFQVLCQGGQQLQYAFYETKDGKLVNAANLQPSLMSAAVKKINFDAQSHLPSETQTTSADLPLGFIGNKPDGATQQYYGLKWNAVAGFYDIVTEDKEIPDPNAAAPANNNNNNGNANANNNNQPTDQNNNNTPAPDNNNSTSNNNNAPTTPGNGTTSPTGSSQASDCKNKTAFDGAGMTPADAGPFHYWTGTGGDSYYCVFGDKFLHAGGFLSTIEVKDKQLFIKVVTASKGVTAGITRVDAGEISGGQVNITLPNKNVTLDIDSVVVYQFDTDKLGGRAGSTRPFEAVNSAWFQTKYLGSDPNKADNLRVNFEADAKSRAARAVETLKGFREDQSGLFGGGQGDNRAKLKKFLELQIDADKGNLDPDVPPFATISLNLTDAARTGGGDVAVYTFKDKHAVGLRWVVPNTGAAYLEDPK